MGTLCLKANEYNGITSIKLSVKFYQTEEQII